LSHLLKTPIEFPLPRIAEVSIPCVGGTTRRQALAGNTGDISEGGAPLIFLLDAPFQALDA
jgi:hypothetical protein